MSVKYVCKRRVIELTEIDLICPRCAQRKWSMNNNYKDCQKYCLLAIKEVKAEEVGVQKEDKIVIVPERQKPPEKPEIKAYPDQDVQPDKQKPVEKPKESDKSKEDKPKPKQTGQKKKTTTRRRK